MESTNIDERVERIKQFMKIKGLTQVLLSQIIDYQQTHISRYLNGRLPLSDAFCYQLVCKFGLNPMWLERGEEPMMLDYNSVKTHDSGVKTSDELVTDLDSFTQMSEDLKTYRRMVNSLNDIIDRQNRRIDELESQVKNSKDVNSDFNPHNFKVESNMFNK